MANGEDKKETDNKKVLDTLNTGERETEKEITNKPETDKNVAKKITGQIVLKTLVDENITKKVDNIRKQ